MVTVDVPGPSRREEMRLAGAPIGSRNPMALTPRVFWQCMTHPVWSLAALANGGKFSFKNLVRYSKPGDGDDITTFIGRQLNGSLTWEYLDEIRKEWDGPLIVKGILHTDDARQAVKAGADGLVISNHGGASWMPPRLLSLSCRKSAICLAMRQSCYLIAGCALAWMWLGLWPAEQILSCWDAPLCSGWPVLARKAAIMLQIS